MDRYASVAQSVERNHGKVEVSGSIPLGGSAVLKKTDDIVSLGRKE